MGILVPSLSLKPVSYHPQLLEASVIVPGDVAALSDCLQAAVRISCVSPTILKHYKGHPLPNGPFGAVRTAVKARAAMRLLHDLRGERPEKIVREVMSLKALVVGMGWNCVNSADSSKGSDPRQHAEMHAIDNTALALEVPVALWEEPEYDLAFFELSSAENCATCRSRNELWAGCLLSAFALLGDQVVRYSGFVEGDQPQDRRFREPWAKMPDYAAHRENPMAGHLMGHLYVPGYEEDAKVAFDRYRETGAKVYQSTYTGAIAEMGI